MSADSTLRAVVPAPVDGDDTKVHCFEPTDQARCDLFPGAVFDGIDTWCSVTFLRGATEISQGHGSIVSAGSVGVNLW